MMSEAGFSLRKCNSNNKELERFFENEEIKEMGVNVENNDITFSEVQLNENKKISNNVLGMDWDKEKDQFVFEFGEFLGKCYDMNLKG